MSYQSIRIVSLHSIPGLIDRQLRRNGFVRNVLTIFFGQLTAQVVAFCAAPLITRLYSTEALGMYAKYCGIVAVVSTFATGKFELAVLLPRRKRTAQYVFFLSLGISTIVSFLVLLVTIAPDFISKYIVSKELGMQPFVWTLPFSIIFASFITVLQYVQIREKRFNNNSLSSTFQSLLAVAVQIGCGFITYLNGSGLLLGLIVGQLASMLFLLWKAKDYWCLEESFNKKIVKSIAVGRTYVDVAKNMLVANVINATTPQIPVFVLSAFSANSEVGYFALAQRVIQTPLSLIVSGVYDVFLQKSVELAKTDSQRLRIVSLQMSLVLLAIGAVPALILMLFGPQLFSFVFGPTWERGGEYARIIGFAIWFQFGFSPLCKIFHAIGRRGIYQAWEWLRFLLCGVGAYIGARFLTPLWAITFYTAGLMVSYLILAWMSYVVLKNFKVPS